MGKNNNATFTITGIISKACLANILDNINRNQNIEFKEPTFSNKEDFEQIGEAIKNTPNLQKIAIDDLTDFSENGGGISCILDAVIERGKAIELEIGYRSTVADMDRDSAELKLIDLKISMMLEQGFLSGLTIKLDIPHYEGQIDNIIKSCVSLKEVGQLKMDPKFKLVSDQSLDTKDIKESLLGSYFHQQDTLIKLMGWSAEDKLAAEDGTYEFSCMEI